MIKILIENGVDVTESTPKGRIALNELLFENDRKGHQLEVAKLLIENGANPLIKDYMDKLPFENSIGPLRTFLQNETLRYFKISIHHKMNYD